MDVKVPLLFLPSDLFFDAMAPCLGAIGGLYEHSGYNFFPFFEALSTVRVNRIESFVVLVTYICIRLHILCIMCVIIVAIVMA